MLQLALAPHRSAVADIVAANSTAETTIEVNNVNTNRANDVLVVGNNGGPGLRRSLITFGDITALVGPGRQIDSAILTLTVESTNGTAAGSSAGVFAATRAWTEGTGSGSSGGMAPFGATWNAARREGNDGIGEGDVGDTDGPSFWSNPGGDFVGTTGLQATSPFATGVIVAGSPTTWTFDVTALAQAWYAGSITNNGLMVAWLVDPSTPGRVSFKTSDQTTPGSSSTFPRLEINVAVPEAGAYLMGAVAAIASGVGAWLKRR